MNKIGFASHYLIAMAIGVCCYGCSIRPLSQNTPDTEAVTPQQLNAQPDKYDGKKVRVRGYLYIDSHAICLVEPDYSDSDSPPDDAVLSVLGLELLKPNFDKYGGKEIIVSATYRSDVVPKPGFLLRGCGSSGIIINDSQKPPVLRAHRK